MKPCIGIVSYFPNDPKIRPIRIARLDALLQRCSQVLDLPILIVAQNWQDYQIKSNCSKIIVYSYKGRLGIVGARRKLREIFLNSEYDYLIMLDDDAELRGDKALFDRFLKELESNPDGFCKIKDNTLLQLFSISKEISFFRISFRIIYFRK